MPSDYDSGGGHTTESDGDYTVSDYDQISSQIPLWGAWSGARGRIAAAEDAKAEDENRAYWDSLNAPTADQLTADYNYTTSERQAQEGALSQLQEWGRGGLTGADRAMMEATRRRDEQASASERGAISQQSQARGMGGSGLDYASQLSSSQQGQQRSSDSEAQMMASAQQRALSSIQQSGELASTMRGQSQREVENRAEAPVQGIQAAYDAATTRAAGATNQYSQDAANRQSARDSQSDTDDSLLGFLGEII